MKRILWTGIFAVIAILYAPAQEALTLQRCRELALGNNKQLSASKLSSDIALNTRKAAETKKLPHVSGMAGAEYFSREISILNNNQKNALNHLGTNAVNKIGNNIEEVVADLVQQGLVSYEAAQQFSSLTSQAGSVLAQKGDEIGNTIRQAFRTNTHSIYSAAITVTQPVYMGGGITAANEIARIGELMAQNNIDNTTQNTLFAIDNAYWLAVSLKNKEQLARQYLELIRKLNSDVHTMIREGVATRADGLKVDVAVNTADLQVTKVEDGVALAKMYLCQLCGLPLNGNIVLADECKDTIAEAFVPEASSLDYTARPEVRLLQNAIDLSEQSTKLTQSLYKPHVAVAGGVLVSNPNTFNGFERKFKDVWNIGIIVQVPIWNWHEGRYKANASRTATRIAQMELADVQEKIALQVEQSRFKVKEANKKLAMARKNMSSAEENLRCANIGFREGVMTVTEVMEAQTMWQQARTQIIDAGIDVKLSQIALQKALGTLYE